MLTGSTVIARLIVSLWFLYINRHAREVSGILGVIQLLFMAVDLSRHQSQAWWKPPQMDWLPMQVHCMD